MAVDVGVGVGALAATGPLPSTPDASTAAAQAIDAVMRNLVTMRVS
ncbi:MAG: hypothetical protein HY241_13690 [Actinobacteria bacterium]|nr:hypothetical protein [Actinomycetota bacterium]